MHSALNLFKPHNHIMKVSSFLLLLALLAMNINADPSLDPISFVEIGRNAETPVGSPKIKEHYLELSSGRPIIYIHNQRALSISIIPLLSERHIDDTTLKILMESDDDCFRSVYKLNASIATDFTYDPHPTLICGKQYDLRIPFSEGSSTYQFTLLSGCDMVLLQVKNDPITA